jgi:hypothetical protein
MDIKDAGIRIAFYPLGEGQLEIIEFQKPLENVDPLVLKPRAGVQHVAFQVEDFEGALKELTDKGKAPMAKWHFFIPRRRWICWWRFVKNQKIKRNKSIGYLN